MMPWQILLLGFLFACLVGVGIWRVAYRLGFKQGRSTMAPFYLIDELLDHKICCLGQDPATARIEVGTYLGIEEWEAQALVQEIFRERSTASPHAEHENTPLASPAQWAAEGHAK